MDGEAGWWNTRLDSPPLARVMGVGRQQQQHEDVLGGDVVDGGLDEEEDERGIFI